MLWTARDERRLRALVIETEASLRHRLKDTPARDLMPYFTWDALIAGYMGELEWNLKAAMIAAKIADEFDPTDQIIDRRGLQLDLFEYVLFPTSGIRYDERWPEWLGNAVTDPFESEVNDFREEAVGRVLGVART